MHFISSIWHKLLLFVTTRTDLQWYPPNKTSINNLSTAINGTGVYGFIFNTSMTSDSDYGIYNYCNMPHVRRREYQKPDDKYELRYVEVIHRHHKRTTYDLNAFPHEPYPWTCADQNLFHYGQPQNGNQSARTYWRGYQSPQNPFQPPGFQGSSCEFPQITKEGLDDSWQHGRDLWEVYRELLGLLPGELGDGRVEYRVTGNVITSQVAGMVVSGMYGSGEDVPLLKQPSSIDSLEPVYPCSPATGLFRTIRSTLTWTKHLTLSKPLFKTLDAISGVLPSSPYFHESWDPYFDSLSSRLCHQKPLPCSLKNQSQCINQGQANAVFRLGQWEYSYMYRDAPESLAASVGSFGVWIAELVGNIRDVVGGKGRVVYKHNVAHDGSLARLLSILQVEEMVWPGVGAEVAFEVYWGKEKGDWFMRVLWGGRVLRSSSPQLGVMDVVPLDRVLAYFDGLVGIEASKVVAFCRGS